MKRATAINDSFKDFVLDQLRGLEGLACRAMFGGHGLYSGRIFFGILHRGRFYLRTNDTTQAEYESRGMKRFQPNERQTMRYHEVPATVIEDASELLRWANQAITIAHD